MRQIVIFAMLLVSSLASYANDWIDTEHFRAANDSVRQLDASRRRIVLMGNSISHNWAAFHKDFLDAHGIVGRGISGQTTSHFLARFRQDVIDLKPEMVIIFGGTNDIAENHGEYNDDLTMNNIISMVELAKANGIRPVLCAVLPVTSYWWRPEAVGVQDKIDSLNRRIEAYAREHGIPYADFFTPLAMPDRTINPAYADDGVHPNPDGYVVMEKVLLDVLGEK